jgi:hypothetical protein
MPVFCLLSSVFSLLFMFPTHCTLIHIIISMVYTVEIFMLVFVFQIDVPAARCPRASDIDSDSDSDSDSDNDSDSDSGTME